MINFNQLIPDKNNLNEPTWKVLIYDRFGQDILSPLLNTKELRDLGVTINLYEAFLIYRIVLCKRLTFLLIKIITFRS